MNRKNISQKTKLKILKRDTYTCCICGRSGVELDIDHIVPHSKGGTDEESNLQTLCVACNRSKGNTQGLDKNKIDDLKMILNRINPIILKTIRSNTHIMICANSEDFVELNKIARNFNDQELRIEHTNNVIYGFNIKVGGCEIYPVNDNYGSKNIFLLFVKEGLL